MKKRTQSREYAVQMMYQAEITCEKSSQVVSTFWKSFENPQPDVMEFAEELFAKAHIKREEHDLLIRQFLKQDWPFDRLGEMEKSILRVGIDELLNSSTPAYAVMDEYVTLARRFIDEKTASFVNGLLESVRNKFKTA